MFGIFGLFWLLLPGFYFFYFFLLIFSPPVVQVIFVLLTSCLEVFDVILTCGLLRFPHPFTPRDMFDANLMPISKTFQMANKNEGKKSRPIK